MGKFCILKFLAIVLAVLVLVSGQGLAQQPELGMPLRCEPGKTCWIVNYVDLDPGEGIVDYACGTATYNVSSKRGKRHQGLDFAIRDLGVMRQGVKVLAAAPGVVLGVRDGMADVSVKEIGHAALKGRDCGNQVGIQHPGGWLTQYCHLRQGSVAVRNGDHVATGQMIGMVGLSGFTEYPHLHIQVMKKNKIVDPFSGISGGEKCSLGDRPLWKEEVLDKLPYRPTALYNAGFAGAVPRPAEAREGRLAGENLAATAKALILWADIFQVRKGDKLEFSIVTPSGTELLRHAQIVKRDQARHFIYAGKPLKAPRWSEGTYRGEIRLVRENGRKGSGTYFIMREITLR